MFGLLLFVGCVAVLGVLVAASAERWLKRRERRTRRQRESRAAD